MLKNFIFYDQVNLAICLKKMKKYKNLCKIYCNDVSSF